MDLRNELFDESLDVLRGVWTTARALVAVLGMRGGWLAASVPGVTERPVLPPDQYVASLARKRMAATAFFRDEQGRVLVVNPVYKPVWDLPGGARTWSGWRRCKGRT
jgi:hypothetical protein